MKKIILMNTALFLSYVSLAQSDSTMKYNNEQIPYDKTMEMSKTDGVMMKNSMMMRMKNGKTSSMTQDFVCNDGTKVTSYGTVIKKDGSQTTLKEGDYLDVSGKVTPLNDPTVPTDKYNSKPGMDKNMYLAPDSVFKNK